MKRPLHQGRRRRCAVRGSQKFHAGSGTAAALGSILNGRSCQQSAGNGPRDRGRLARADSRAGPRGLACGWNRDCCALPAASRVRRCDPLEDREQTLQSTVCSLRGEPAHTRFLQRWLSSGTYTNGDASAVESSKGGQAPHPVCRRSDRGSRYRVRAATGCCSAHPHHD